MGTGQVVMEVANAAAACEDGTIADSLAEVKAEKAGVPLGNVAVSCDAGERRLASSSRRLAETVTYTYEIIVSSAEEANDLAAEFEDMTTEELAAAVQAKLPEGSDITVIVTSKSATAVVVTITTTTTTEDSGRNPGGGDELDDSHARAPAALGSVAMAVVAA